LLDAYGSTIALGWLKERLKRITSGTLRLQELRELLVLVAKSGFKETYRKNIPWQQMKLKMIGLRFFSTNEGYIGFGPGCCEPGR